MTEVFGLCLRMDTEITHLCKLMHYLPLSNKHYIQTHTRTTTHTPRHTNILYAQALSWALSSTKAFFFFFFLLATKMHICHEMHRSVY